MTYAEGALVEPLSVAAGAVARASPKLGQPVLVCGAGPIGLAAALCARAAGAHPVCITDLDEHRLAQAKSFGFEHTVKVDLKWTREEFGQVIRDQMGEGCHPEIAFECTGAQSSIAGSIYVSTSPAAESTASAELISRCFTGSHRRWNASPGWMWKARYRASHHGHVLPRNLVSIVLQAAFAPS